MPDDTLMRELTPSERAHIVQTNRLCQPRMVLKAFGVPCSDRFGGGERREAAPVYVHWSAERKAAIDAYWAANTPLEAREAYDHMIAIGMSDGYAQTVCRNG